MKLMWHISSPFHRSGYGNIARQILPRIRDNGHDIIIASKMDSESTTWQGMQVINGKDAIGLVQYVDYCGDIDYVIDTQDPWDTPTPFGNTVALACLDIDYAYPEIVKKLERARYQFCVSQHNLKEYRKFGLNPFYAPWGIDTKLYTKKSGAREKFNKLYKIPDNTFLIGTVGQNMFSDRKNFTGLLRAFAYFSDRHENAMLYMHTAVGTFYTLYSDYLRGGSGMAPWLARMIREFGLEKKVIFPDQIKLINFGFSEEDMTDIYSSFDVFCLPTRGESFCLPLLESQSCEVPVIVTDSSACTEAVQKDAGWLIPIEEDDLIYTDTGSWAVNPRPKMIAEYLEYGMEAWENDKLAGMGKTARESTSKYNWDTIFNKYWISFLETLRRNA